MKCGKRWPTYGPHAVSLFCNTISSLQCGGHGHLSIDCFSRGDQKYDLLEENDDDRPIDSRHSRNGGEMRGVRREVRITYRGVGVGVGRGSGERQSRSGR